MANVAIGFISDTTVEADFLSCLLRVLAQRAPDIRGRVIHTQGVAGRLDVGRTKVAHAFMEATDADYLLMLDTDIVFTVEDYDQIMLSASENTTLGLVSGLYARSDGTFCVFDAGAEQFYVSDPEQVVKHKWYEAGAVGMGFCLIPREVLAQVREANNDEMLPWFDQTVAGYGRLADDTSFCYRVQKLGIPIHVNTDIQLGHLKTIAMFPRVPERPELIVAGKSDA